MEKPTECEGSLLKSLMVPEPNISLKLVTASLCKWFTFLSTLPAVDVNQFGSVHFQRDAISLLTQVSSEAVFKFMLVLL